MSRCYPYVIALLAALLVAGCSGDDEDSGGKEKTSTTAETAPAEKPKAGSEKARKGARGGKKTKKNNKNKKKKKKKKKKGPALKRQVSKAELEKERRALRREEARDRREDRKFDESFNETAFEKLVAELPIRKPPLFVQQYITSRGSSTVYTTVAPKRFFCGRSPARRKAAVSAFYEDADRVFRRGGVKDFVQIVTPVADTTESLPALAVGREGKVSLTKRGRAKGPC